MNIVRCECVALAHAQVYCMPAISGWWMHSLSSCVAEHSYWKSYMCQCLLFAVHQTGAGWFECPMQKFHCTNNCAHQSQFVNISVLTVSPTCTGMFAAYFPMFVWQAHVILPSLFALACVTHVVSTCCFLYWCNWFEVFTGWSPYKQKWTHGCCPNPSPKNTFSVFWPPPTPSKHHPPPLSLC